MKIRNPSTFSDYETKGGGGKGESGVKMGVSKIPIIL